MAEEPFQTPYPHYDVLDKWDTPSFNEATRRTLAHRLQYRPPRRFFDEREFALLRAIIDTVLPQPERGEEERIPVEYFLDEKLHDNATDGTRPADMPRQQEAWRIGLRAIDDEARDLFGRDFVALSPEERHRVLEKVDAGDGGEKHWTRFSGKRFFRHVLMRQSVKIYYAHPLAWNEMGFGGPAAPRGYVRLGPDMRDPWEAEEERRPQTVRRLP
jgi:hypothetical protein